MNSGNDMEALFKELEQAVCQAPLNRALVLDLIRRGADPNFQRKEGSESFFTELLFDEDLPFEAVELLLEAGADPNHDPGDGSRPLVNAYHARRADVVELLLRRGADPNFLVERIESLLNMVDCRHWYETSQIGTAWEQDYQKESVDQLAEILEILEAAGAKSMQDMETDALDAWVHLGARSPGKLLTRKGYIFIGSVPGLTEDWRARWRDWCGRSFDPGREGSILDAPAGFDRRTHNGEGLELAREFKRLAGEDVSVDLFLIDPDDEERFATNDYKIEDVGGAEKHPSLSHPFAKYAERPGFHLRAKVLVAPDFSDVEVSYEFFAHGKRYRPELTLNYGELARSIGGDGRYAMFSGTGESVMVDVLWGEDTVLWRVELPAGSEDLAFFRENYPEVIEDAPRWAYHTDRRARIAIDRFKNKVPTLTNTGHIPSPAEIPARDCRIAELLYEPAGEEAELAARSRIWEICVYFAAAVNLREVEILAGRMTEHVCLTGDRRPGIHGKKAVMDYFQLAFDELRERVETSLVRAEVGYFPLSCEPCVLLWEGGKAVALANARCNPEREFTSCHVMTEAHLVQSVKPTRVFPALKGRA